MSSAQDSALGHTGARKWWERAWSAEIRVRMAGGAGKTVGLAVNPRMMVCAAGALPLVALGLGGML